MPAKPVFNDEQYEVLHVAARRVWKTKFQKRGKTQEDMGQALGITQQSISNLLKGTYRPGLEVAKGLAVLDGTTLEELIGDYAVSTKHESRPPPSGEDRFPNLAVCERFYVSKKRWSPWTIAAAHAGFFGPNDHEAPDWVEKLDVLEKALASARKAVT